MNCSPKKATIYLCGAGGKGNAGAEAIFLAIIKLFQRRFPDAHFIITSWYPERVKILLQGIRGSFDVIGHESSFHNPLTVRRSDYLSSAEMSRSAKRWSPSCRFTTGSGPCPRD
jgi:polysaccharide pyruvyl transferase WcaK-like protein